MNRREITAEDLALYAMNLLEDANERRAVELFLAGSPEARQELALIRGDLALFALGTEMHTPPALAKQRLMKDVARERKPLPFAGFDAAAQQQQAFPPQQRAPYNSQQREAYPSQQREAFPQQQRDAFPPQQSPYASQPTGEYQQVQPQRDEPQFLRAYQDAASQYDSDDDVVERRSNVITMVLPWVGWAAAAGLAIFSFTLMHQRDALTTRYQAQAVRLAEANESAEHAQLVVDTLTAPTAQRVVLMDPKIRPPANGRVTYLAERGSLLFQGSNLEQLPVAKTYELWLIPAAAGAKPVAAGTFKPDANGFAQIMLPDMPKGLVASKFGVTVEDEGGADEPTMPIVMVGQ